MATFDFDGGPKKIFVDRFDARGTPRGIEVGFRSGGDTSVFLLEWGLAKKLAKYFSQVVQDIEKKNNVNFDDRLDNEPLLSPLKIGPESK